MRASGDHRGRVEATGRKTQGEVVAAKGGDTTAAARGAAAVAAVAEERAVKLI